MSNYDFLSQIKGGKRLTQCSNLSAYVVDVMPEMANSLLMLNFEHNRKLRTASVNRFADMMRRGEFVDGSQIRLDKVDGKYVLVDGQHRLTAISESGQAATMVVVVSEKDTDAEVRDEYSKVDSGGFLRSLSDVVTALDVDEELPAGWVLASFASAARLIIANFDSRKANTVSRLAIYPTMKEFKQAINLTREWFGSGRLTGAPNTTRGFMRGGVLAVAIVTTHHAEMEVAQNFWRAAYEDDGLRRNDPRKKLNEYLRGFTRNGGGMQWKTCAVVAKCWNAYIAGDEIAQLKMPKSMPSIALTPYPLKEEMPTEE